MAGDIYIDVVPFTTVNFANKTITSSNLNGLTPKAVIIFGGLHLASTSGETEHAQGMIGFAVNGGGNAVHTSATSDTTGGGWTSSWHSQWNNRVVGVSKDNGGMDHVATVASWGANSVTLSFGVFATAGVQMYAMLIAGSDVDVSVGQTTMSTGTATVSSLAFQPDCVVVATSGNSATINTGSNGGWRMVLGASTRATAKNYCVGSYEGADFFTSGLPYTTAFYNDACGFQANTSTGALNYKLAINNYTSTGFDITQAGSGSATGNLVSWLALRFNGGDVDIAEFVNATATGVVTKVSGLSFKPAAGIVGTSGLTSATIERNTDAASSASFGMWADQVSQIAEGSHSYRVARNVNPTDSKQIAKLQSIRPGTNTNLTAGTIGNINAINADGLDVNYTQVSGNAEKVWMLLFKGAPPPSIEIDVHQQGMTVVARLASPIDVLQQGATVVLKQVAGIEVHQQGFTVVAHRTPRPFNFPVPEEPIGEEWTWQTDIITAEDGTEQRIALRSTPVVETTHALAFDNQADLRRHYRVMLNDIRKPVPVPQYVTKTQLTAGAVTGALRLYFDPIVCNARAGGFIFVDDGDHTAIARIQSIEVDGAVLYETLGGDFDAGADVMPLTYNIPSQVGALKRVAPDTFGTADMVSMDRATISPFPNPLADAYTLPECEGLPILHRRPVSAQGFDEVPDAGADVLQLGAGKADMRSLWDRAKISGSRSYLLHRLSNSTDMQWLATFADYCKGSCFPFLLPSWRSDFDLAVSLSNGATTVTLEGTEYVDTFWPHAGMRYIGFETADALLVRKVTGAVLSASGLNSVLTLSEALPDPAPTVLKVQLVQLARLAADKVAVTHFALHSLADFGFRTIDE